MGFLVGTSRAMPPISEDVRVAFVEDDVALRTTHARLVDHAEGLTCVGEYGTVESALSGLKRRPADVLVLDLGLPGADGEEFLERRDPRAVPARVLVLTVHDDSDRVFRALLAGASGYLAKPANPQELVKSIRDLHAGGSPMSPGVARRVTEWLHEEGRKQRELESLTQREKRVLELIAEGLTNRAMGKLLGISPRTVESHVQHIYDKLHVRTRAAAAARRGPFAP